MIDIIYHDGASAAPDQAAQSGGFAQADGNGEIHCYSWLDGVSAMLMRLEMESYTELRTQKGLRSSISAPTAALKRASPCGTMCC